MATGRNLDEEWERIQRIADSFTGSANNNWLPNLAASTAPRTVVHDIGGIATKLLKALQNLDVAAVEETARRITGDALFDLQTAVTGWRDVNVTNLQALTQQVKDDYDKPAVDGRLFDINRDGSGPTEGQLSEGDIFDPSGGTTDLQNAISTVVTSLDF